MCFYWTELNGWGKECDDSFRLLAPWHIVHFCPGHVVISGEWTQICSRQEHSRESSGPVLVHQSPGAQRCQVHLRLVWGSEFLKILNLKNKQHFFWQSYMSPGSAESPWKVLPALGQALCRKGCWSCFLFLSVLDSFEPKTTCLIPTETQ